LASVLACGSAPVRADNGDLGRQEVRVLTQNMYIGTDLSKLVGATMPAQFIATVAAMYQDILASKPAERAAAMAAEIAKQRPDFVALHEAWKLLRVDHPEPPVMDLLQSILDALNKLAQHYVLVGTVTGLNVVVPTKLALGFDIHLTDRGAMLMRTDVGILTIDKQSRYFPTSATTPTPIGTITSPGGYVAIDAIIRGQPLRFVSVHLTPSYVMLAQTNELLQLAANTTTLPLVFAGDFNTTADDPSDPSYAIYQTLINAGLTDAWNPWRPGPTCCQDPNLLNTQSKLDHRIDLILLRGAFAVENINLIGNRPSDRTPSGLWPSDHAGIVATLAGPESQQGNQNGQGQNGQGQSGQ
jgi:hypothetical protein